MTYREHLTQLRKDTMDKFGKFLKAENELVIDAQATFIDKTKIDNHKKAHQEWQDAHNEFLGTLSFITKNQINLDSKLGS